MEGMVMHRLKYIILEFGETHWLSSRNEMYYDAE